MSGSAPQPKCLLFDLGGVLVEWNGIEPLIALTEGRLDAEQARRFWLESQWVRRFEAGQCDPAAFATGVVQELRVAVAPDAFLEAFISWDRGPMPGSAELLQQLRPGFTLACLSNNNTLHWRKPEIQALVGLFDRAYASFKTGLMKPDSAAFQHVLSDLALRPEEVLFFDDNPECVMGAHNLGINACIARGPAMARTKLSEFGIL